MPTRTQPRYSNETLTRCVLQFTASMWTPEEAKSIHAEAKEIMGPQLKTFALPQGLQVSKGPDAVVEFIEENLPALLEG